MGNDNAQVNLFACRFLLESNTARTIFYSSSLDLYHLLFKLEKAATFTDVQQSHKFD